MATEDRKPRRDGRPHDSGWELGAGGLTKVGWGILTALLLALTVLLFATGYLGYGAMIMVLAAAAAVNLF
ncbi:MAG: hypothetical protein RIB67_04885 [Miltoncostaeaceae bacterium]